MSQQELDTVAGSTSDQVVLATESIGGSQLAFTPSAKVGNGSGVEDVVFGQPDGTTGQGPLVADEYELAAGETVTLKVDATNNRDSSYTLTVDFTEDGSQFDSVTKTIASGATETFSTTRTKASAFTGTYQANNSNEIDVQWYADGIDPGTLTVDDDSVDLSIESGEVAFTYPVSNTGASDVSFEAIFYENGTEFDRETKIVPAGESVDFTTTRSKTDTELGTYDYQANSSNVLSVEWFDSETTTLVEDFEDQQFTDTFSVISGGDAWQITTEAFEGSYALLFDRDDASTEISEGIVASKKTFGTFPLKFRTRVKVKNKQDETNEAEDGDIYFAYQDIDNNFRLNIKPEGTDNPQLSLQKITNGSLAETVFDQSPEFSREEWLTVRAEIDSAGSVAVEVDHPDGTQRATGTISDTSEFDSGPYAPRGFVFTVYDLVEVNQADGGGELPDVI